MTEEWLLTPLGAYKRISMHSRRSILRAVPHAGAALVVVALVLPRAALAEARTVDLSYAAPAGCPDRSAFTAMVAKRAESVRFEEGAPNPDLRLAVSLEIRANGAVSGHLRVSSAQQSAARSVDGESCEEVASAIALIGALAIDHAVMPDPPPPGSSEPTNVSPPTPPPVVELPPPVVWHPPPAPPVAPPPPPSAPTADFALGGAFAFDYGAAPRPLVGASPSLEVRMLTKVAWSIRASGIFQVAPTFDYQGATASFSLLRGRVDGCVFRWNPGASVFSLWPCALIEGGAVQASMVRIHPTPNKSDGTSPWLAIGPLARAELAPAKGVTFELAAGPTFPIFADSYLFGASEVWVTPPVALTTSLGLVLRP